MKILFLDVDGVLTSYRTCVGLGDNETWTEFDPVAVEIIRKICTKHNYKIVIISTWRKGAPEKLKKQMDKCNLSQFYHKDWQTKYLNISKGAEIFEWLKRNIVDDYIILDDDNDYLKNQQEHLIQTDPMNGLMEEHIQQLIIQA